MTKNKDSVSIASSAFPKRTGTSWFLSRLSDMPCIKATTLSNNRVFHKLSTIQECQYLPPANEVCEGYVFTRVCHSAHKGECLPQCMLGCTPPSGPEAGTPWDQRQTPLDQRQTTPPGPEAGTSREQCMLGDTGNKWAVRILLDCILVPTSF